MTFPNKTTEYFYKISFIVFFLGSPNFWIEELNGPKLLYRGYRIFSKLLNIFLFAFIFFELGAFITQKNLTKKQESDLLIYGVSHPILWSYSLIMWSHVEDVKRLFLHIMNLKSIYNDTNVEQSMLRKAKQDSTAFAVNCFLALILHTVGALMQFLKSEGTFTTVVTAWPLADDPSHGAHVVRVICNIFWWLFLSRIIASYTIIIGLVTSISFQYTNLQSYFYSIEDVFVDNSLQQREKEMKYEKYFRLGVKLHSDTIECVKQFQKICKGIFSAQIGLVIILLVFLMTQMMKSERTIMNAAATAITAIAVLISTAFFLWNAGDITVEASKLPTAMYFSGWNNCQGKTARRIRKLVVISMTYAQKPVEIKAFGMMTLSYRSYLSLVKSSYSVFSVIY